MTRRRFYAPPEAFGAEGSSVTLAQQETRHLRNVLRLSPGDEVYVFDGQGNEYRCKLIDLGATSSTADILEQVSSQTKSVLGLTLAVALLKGDKFDLVVQKATELGVQNLVPVITHRADLRIRNQADAERKVSRWRRIALEAMKQCGRADLMKVETPVEFDRLITDSDAHDLRLLFAEHDGVSFDRVFQSSESPARIAAIIGPEGGWTADEINDARQAEWIVVTLAGRTLRAETAAIVVATLLQHRFGDLH
jgi:16S rRNA (uracil1498-N3)-methyltransferase